jgi:hypothetical protein
MKIWDRASTDEVVPSIHKSFLRELGAHPSRQHANKMCVKLGAMFRKNKTEIWAGIFAAASNGFLLLGHDGDQETDKNVGKPVDSIKQEPTDKEKGRQPG